MMNTLTYKKYKSIMENYNPDKGIGSGDIPVHSNGEVDFSVTGIPKKLVSLAEVSTITSKISDTASGQTIEDYLSFAKSFFDHLYLKSLSMGVFYTGSPYIVSQTISFGSGNQWNLIGDDFPIDSPAFSVSILNMFNAANRSFLAKFTGSIPISTKSKTFYIDIEASCPDFEISGSLAKNTTVHLGAMIEKYFPLGELDVFQKTNITTFHFKADYKSRLIRFTLTIDESIVLFKIGSESVELDSTKVFFTYDSGVWSVVFDADLSVGSLDLYTTASFESGSWLFKAWTGENQNIDLSGILSSVFSDAGVNLPSGFPTILLSDVSIQICPGGDDSLAFSATAEIQETDSIFKDAELVVDLKSSVQNGKRQFNGSLEGTLNIGSADFYLTYAFGPSDRSISGSWKMDGGDAITVNDIAEWLGITLPEIPPELDLGVKSAQFSYDFTQKVFVFSGDFTNSTEMVFVAASEESTKTWKYLVGLKLGDRKISLSDLPLVGSKIPNSQNVGISNIQVIASSALTKDQTSDFSGYAPELKLPTQGLNEGVGIAGELFLGDDTQNIFFSTGGSAKDPPTSQKPTDSPSSSNSPLSSDSTDNPSSAATQPDSSAAPQSDSLPSPTKNTKWIAVQKSFGPFYFKKIGFFYFKGKVYVCLDATLSSKGLTITLDGLGLGFSLNNLTDVSVFLQGLDVDFKEGPVTISGGLMSSKISLGGKEVDAYTGEVIIGDGRLSISALGSYMEVEGKPCLFIFAIIDYPLGGSLSFFITGGAGGFGYNRGLVLPSIQHVPTFPLVQAAFGQGGFSGTSDIGGNFALMNKVIPPHPGEDWLAAGIKFTSYEMIKGFVLVSIAFGREFELAFLGLAGLKVPPDGKESIALVELAIEAIFCPDEGILSINGALTPNSFLLSKSCHLTGGFAFDVWFSHAHAGEFVVTIGGYNSKYQIPLYFPKPARVGFNWQVCSDLSIKGGAYFALTPTCVMAGGQLKAVWHSGPLKAWFDMWADFLISWKPFYYDIQLGVEIGVSLHIHVWFINVTLTIKLGANIDIWGPEFSGIVHIEVYFASFSVSFGSHQKPAKPKVSWTEFKNSFLLNAASNQEPSDDGTADDSTATTTDDSTTATSNDTTADMATTGKASSKTTATAIDNPGAVCRINVVKGLIKQIKSTSSTEARMDPELFDVKIHTVVPVKKLKFNGAGVSGLKTWETDFGVGLVKVPSGSFKSKLLVTMTKDKKPIEYAYFKDRIKITEVTSNVSKALWKYIPDLKTEVLTTKGKNKKTKEKNKSLITDVLVGIEIVALVTVPPKETPVPYINLIFNADLTKKIINFTKPDVPTSDNFDQNNAMTEMKDTIGAPDTSETRAGVLGFLFNKFKYINTQIDVEGIVNNASNTWLQNPILSYLGEEKPLDVKEKGYEKHKSTIR